jgi:hypothetical protein
MKIFISAILLIIVSCWVSNGAAQVGSLSGATATLTNGTKTVSLAVPSSLSSSYTLTLPTAQSGSTQFLSNTNGQLAWGLPVDGSSAGGLNFNTSTEQVAANPSTYLFDVEYPAGTSGPLPGAVLLSEINNPNPTTNGISLTARNRNASASGVQVNGIVINVSNSGSGTQTGILAKALDADPTNHLHYGMLLTGTSGTLCGIGTTTPAENLEVTGNLLISGVNGMKIVSGTNGTLNTATLGAGGTVTVSDTRITANSRIFLTTQNVNGGTIGKQYVSARVTTPAGSQTFTISSTNNGDRSIVAYWIVEP